MHDHSLLLLCTKKDWESSDSINSWSHDASSVFSAHLQVYPTASRALGLGMSSGMARVGALITPFVAQVTPSCQRGPHSAA